MDVCAIIASLALVTTVKGDVISDAVLLPGLIATVLFLLLGRAVGLHQQSGDESVDREICCLALTWLLTVIGMFGLLLMVGPSETLSVRMLARWFLITPALMGVCRMAMRIFGNGVFRQGIGTRRVAIAGLNDLGRQAEKNLRNDNTLGWDFVGYYDARKVARDEESVNDHKLIGDLEKMVEDARDGEIDTILITIPMRAEERIREILDKLRDSTVSVYLIPNFFVFEMLHSSLKSIGGLPAVSIFESPLRSIDGIGKRLMDLSLATIGLLIVAAPMLCIAIAIKLTSKGPVIFRQRRYGLNGAEINVWKFRSMTTCDNGTAIKQATKGDSRITPLGAFLRKTSLDELPQLFNVLFGTMSLVGPRPHAAAHNEFYRGQIRGYMLRHKVKPGITGLAQVSGCRGETDTLDKMQRRVDFDHQYIRFWSLWLDAKILVRTVLIVWRQPEAY